MESIPNNIYEKSLIALEKNLMPYKIYYDILIKWLDDKISGKRIESILKEKNIRNIAIYGVGRIGELLYSELKNSNINVKYTLDNNLDNNKIDNYEAVNMNNINFNINIDAIIITPIHASDDIKKSLLNIYSDKNIKLISFEELFISEGEDLE